MKNLILFKGSTGKHSALNLYTNKHAENEYKEYLMLEFRFTPKTQESAGKKVGNFKDCLKITFGMEMGSGHNEIGTLLRFLLKDPKVIKQGEAGVSMLHKTGKSNKSLFMSQFPNGGQYMKMKDNNAKTEVTVSISTAEMLIIAEYIKAALQMYRYTDVAKPRSIEEAANEAIADAESQHLRPDQQPDDELPF